MDLKLAKVLSFIEQAGTEGGSKIPPLYLQQAGDDLVAALNRQFNETRNPVFRLRMSNIGRPLCQLQMEKAGAERSPISAQQRMNFVLGDAVEAVLKAILKSADVSFVDGVSTELDVNGEIIKGDTDGSTEHEIDDIKSASAWAFDNKFQYFEDLVKGDSFGYIGQLVGYAKSLNKDIGGWWVMNKQDGRLTYLRFDADKVDQDAIHEDFKRKELALRTNAPFERCFTDEEDTHYRKPTGHRKLPTNGPCSWCDFRHTCWPGLREIPSLSSKAKYPPMTAYTFVKEDDDGDA